MELTPGTYPIAVEPVTGYDASTQANGHKLGAIGWMNLSARLTTVSVKFTPVLYSFTFDLTGLEAGITWHLAATCTDSRNNTGGCYGMKASGKDVATSTGGSISLLLRGGVYTWKITPIKGYELLINGNVDPTWSGSVAINDSKIADGAAKGQAQEAPRHGEASMLLVRGTEGSASGG